MPPMRNAFPPPPGFQQVWQPNAAPGFPGVMWQPNPVQGNQPAQQPYPGLQPPNMGAPAGPAQGGGGGTINYNTGIHSGQLTDQDIAAARGRLQSPAGMPSRGGPPMSGAAQGQLAQQYGDLMGQGTATADVNLQRDARYQQAQMNLARQKAISQGTLGGYGQMLNLYGADVDQDQAARSLIMRMLGLFGGIGG